MLLVPPPVPALDWSNSNIQYLYGSGYILGSKSRDIITLEHSDGWRFGQNYLFVDTINHRSNADPVSVEAYGEAYSYFSAGKILGRDLAFGPIKDIGSTLGFNAGSQPDTAPFRAYLAGVSVQFNIPNFQFLQIDMLAYKNERQANTAFQLTSSWELPFNLFGLPFRFRGFTDYITAGGVGPAPTIVSQPQLLLDIGALAGYKNRFLLGCEYQYWWNKFGLRGHTESLPQTLMILRF